MHYSPGKCETITNVRQTYFLTVSHLFLLLPSFFLVMVEKRNSFPLAWKKRKEKKKERENWGKAPCQPLSKCIHPFFPICQVWSHLLPLLVEFAVRDLKKRFCQFTPPVQTVHSFFLATPLMSEQNSSSCWLSSYQKHLSEDKMYRTDPASSLEGLSLSVVS